MALRPPRAGIGVARRLSERDRAARNSASPPEATGAGALGGMMEALQGLIDHVSRAGSNPPADADPADTTPNATVRSGTHELRFGSKGASAVFGYTLRMGLDGLSAEPFGDVPEPAAAAPAARQPIVEVLEEPDALVVIAEVPGADPAELRCRIEDGSLLIEADGTRRYRKRIDLPAVVLPSSLRQTLRNGILEIRLTRDPGVAPGPKADGA